MWVSVTPLLEPKFADDGTEMVVEINFTTKVRDTPAATRSTCQHTAPM